MITKAQLISDTILQLTQGSPSDDLELEEGQVAFWLNTYLNSLVANEINSKLAKQELIPAIYVKRASCEAMTIEDVDCGDDCQDRIYAELDEEVLTINKDMGIVRVITSEGDQVLRASTETLDILNNLRFAKPSEQNLVYSRQGKKIYVEGIKESDLSFDKLNIYYVPKQNLLELGDTDEVLVSDLVLPDLISAAVQIGKLQIYGTQLDEENDGVDVKKINYHTAISNPTIDDKQPS